MPLTIGGKIKSIKDIEYRLSLGADKVTINTIAHRNSKFIYEASKEFGSQCIVVSIDAKKINEKYMVATNNGTLISNLECSNWAKEAEECGAGEIFLNSIDRDGMQTGYDINLINSVKKKLQIPLIACGGASNEEDFFKGS